MKSLRLVPVVLLIVGLVGTAAEWRAIRPSAEVNTIEVVSQVSVSGEGNPATPNTSSSTVFLPAVRKLSEEYRSPSMVRVSVDSSGRQANGNSYGRDMTPDGRFVVFQSEATNLVPGDSNGVRDVFVHDRHTGQTTRVSIGTDGTQGNGPSSGGKISADGRYVAYVSIATSLVAGDANAFQDVFVHDRQTGETALISLGHDGTPSNGDSGWPDISADGRYVVFESGANNLDPGDTDTRNDVFLHDRQSPQTILISTMLEGTSIGGETPSISADGRFTAFAYDNGIYLYDHSLAKLYSAYQGGGGYYAGQNPEISGDGNFIVYETVTHDDIPWPGGPVTHYTLNRYDRQAGTSEFFGNHVQPFFGSSPNPTLSLNGRFAAFGDGLIFVLDFHTEEVVVVSTNLNGENPNGVSMAQAISADGRVIMMESVATDLVANDTNGVRDVFMRDRGSP